jgi:hypothetical protein
MALNTTQKQVLDIIRQPTGTMAYTYENAVDIVKAVKMYIDFNIDDVAGSDVGAMTLDEVMMLLDGKVEHYSRFVQSDKQGVYIDREEKRINLIQELYASADEGTFKDLESLTLDQLEELDYNSRLTIIDVK